MVKKQVSRKQIAYDALLLTGPLSLDDLVPRVAVLETLGTRIRKIVNRPNTENLREHLEADLKADGRFYLRGDGRWELVDVGQLQLSKKKKFEKAKKRSVNLSKMRRAATSKTPRVRFWRG